MRIGPLMPKNRRIIVSAANELYFPLLTDLISSIEDGKAGSDVEIGVLDVGLTVEQRSMLTTRVRHIVAPNWDYQSPTLNTVPQKFQAMTARPHLPKHFPGYDIIMWIDADAWIQQWATIEHFFDKAETSGLTICQEMDRSYDNVYDLNNSRQAFFESLKAYGNDVSQNLIWMPMVNCGVFAMRSDSRYWSQWGDTLGGVIQRGHFEFMSEQTALNICVYRRLPFPYFMPSRFNWICVHAVPRFDERTLLYVDPAVPHDAIGIVHLAGVRTRRPELPVVMDLDGNKTGMSLLYSQWKQYRDQRKSTAGDRKLGESRS